MQKTLSIQFLIANQFGSNNRAVPFKGIVSFVCVAAESDVSLNACCSQSLEVAMKLYEIAKFTTCFM